MPPSVAEPLVSVILLNCNGSEDTIECVGSLEEMKTRARLDVIVVDNGSAPADRAALRQALESRVRFIWNDTNQGFCAGNNAGIRAALAAGCDYILILNNDTVVGPAFLDALLDAIATHGNKTVVTGKILYAGRPDTIRCAGGEFRPDGTPANRGMDETDRGQYDRIEPVDFFSGCAVLLPVSALREAGLFWEWLFIYYEDVELSQRLKFLGYSILYVPEAVVRHKVSRTTGGAVSAHKMYLTLRNRRVVYCRHPWASPGRFVVSDLRLMARCLAIALKHLDFRLARAVFTSLAASLFALARGRGCERFRHVVLVDYSWRGGISQYTNHLAEALAQRGWKVWVCANRRTPFPQRPAFTALVIFRPIRERRPRGAPERWAKKALLLGDYMANFLSLARVVWRVRPQVLHFQSVMAPALDARLLRLLCSRVGSLLLTAHNLLPHDSDETVQAPLFRRLYRRCDRIIVHSAADKSDLEGLLADGGPPVLVSPFPVLFPTQAIEPPNRDAARTALGLPMEAEVILFFGRIRPYKGLDILIEAFGRLARGREKALLAIVGQAEDFAPYRRMIDATRVARRVVTRPEYVADEEAAMWFAAADVVALPHRAVFQSAVAAAALAFGKPIVASAVGGLAEMVRDGVNGKSVAPNDASALAAALEAMLADPEQLRLMGRESERLARDAHSWAAAVEATERIYLGLAGE